MYGIVVFMLIFSAFSFDHVVLPLIVLSTPSAKASDMIAKVKASIQDNEGSEEQLKDDRISMAYDIQQQSTLHLVLRMCEGMQFVIGTLTIETITISVIATVGHTSPESLDATGDTATIRLNNFKSRDLAHTAWAFPTIGHAPLEHFHEIAETNTSRLKNFNSQHLAQTVWAIYTIGHTSLELFDATAVTTFGRLKNFVSQDFAHTVWAISTIDHTSLEPLYAIAESPICRMKHFNVQDLAHTAWAISMIGHAHSELFDAPAETAICCVKNFNSQALAHTVWAISMTGHTSVELFAAIAEAAIGCLKPFILKTSRTQYELYIARACRMHLQNDFNSQLLAIPAWAFCEFGLGSCHDRQCITRACWMQLQNDFNSPYLEITVWTQKISAFHMVMKILLTIGYVKAKIQDKKGIPATRRLQIFLKTFMGITIIIDVEATPVYMCEDMQIIVKTMLKIVMNIGYATAKIQDKEGISRRSLLAIRLLRICESMQIYVKA